MDRLGGDKFISQNGQLLPEPPMLNLLGGGDRIVFDPNNIQSFITFQGKFNANLSKVVLKRKCSANGKLNHL